MPADDTGRGSELQLRGSIGEMKEWPAVLMEGERKRKEKGMKERGGGDWTGKRQPRQRRPGDASGQGGAAAIGERSGQSLMKEIWACLALI